MSSQDVHLHYAFERIRHGFPSTTRPKIRMHHFGVYVLIRMLKNSDQPTTTTNLADVTGLYRYHVINICSNLSDLGLVVRTIMRAGHGRGRQFSYHPVDDLKQLSRLVRLPPLKAVK